MTRKINVTVAPKGNSGLSFADKSVLIVDDNDYIRDLVQRLLLAMGFAQVAEATCALTAFKSIKGSAYDLVISDWEMPGKSGLDFLKACRDQLSAQTSHTCFIMLTAHSDRENVIEAREAGVDGFVVKPISPQLLYERVTSALTLRHQKMVGDDVYL